MQFWLVRSIGKFAGIAGIGLAILLIVFKGVLQDLPDLPGLEPGQTFTVILFLMTMSFGVAGISIIASRISRNEPEQPVSNFGLGVLGATFIVVVLLAGYLSRYANAEISVQCVAIHLRENQQHDWELIRKLDAAIDDMNVPNCHVTPWPNDSDPHLSVDYYIKSDKMKNEAIRLANKVRKLRPEFQEIHDSRETLKDPKLQLTEKYKLGLYLIP